ncbi:prepilin-type N-terminal cleavage/methylation domain-containing protein [Candidatus Saccharibacteria bacterium]|nr:prepilin-type N-terminal cleavage/methylation domain-containing protein [Candidatus Saccharibacteria bacterium]MBI3337798.1 prepilin-type N-terminal cleavage/methylation domain-containing protein [Candidatus Saccharibacteria bacterium]
MKLAMRGDTIVEVLIAITIIGIVLSGAYVAVNSSLNASQDSLERSSGTKLAESQLERLKSVSDDEITAAIFDTSKHRVFCMDTSNTRQDFTTKAVGDAMPPPDSDILSSPPGGDYPASCIIDNANDEYNAGSRGIQYYVSIERDETDHHKWIARARWQGTGIKGVQEASVAYRVY